MSRTRTFVAVPLGDAQRQRLDRLRIELARRLPDIKWTEPENLHVTLVFLGEVDDRQLPRVCAMTQAAVEALALTPFALELTQLGCFPHERRPRVIWVGVADGAEPLARLHEALAQQFEELGYRREDRRFTAHVTLGRTKAEGPVRSLVQLLAEHQSWTAGDTTVHEIHVMGSELTREGPRYTVIGRAQL